MSIGLTSVERLVVRGTNWVGDAVMTVPALRSLRQVFPHAHITLATRSWARGLFAEADFLDDLLVHEGSGLKSVVQHVRQWRSRNFDVAVLFPNSLESALVASLTRVPIRIGYATDGRQRLLTHPLVVPDWRSSKHEVFYYLNIVEQLQRVANHPNSGLGISPDPSLSVSDERKQAAQEMLRAKGVGVSGSQLRQPVIALCPGSINSRAKRWPTERFAAVADRLVRELDAQIVLIGSPAETEVSNEVTEAMRSPHVTLTGQTDLAELVAVLSVIDLLITNDTGPAHIASALGRPTLVIFGPTNPLTTKPYSKTGEIIRVPPECAPCMLRDCPIDHRCMTAIGPNDVFERAEQMLASEAQVAL